MVEFAERYPWWGYKRLTIVMRRAGHEIGKKFVHAVFKAEDLFQKRKPKLGRVAPERQAL